MMNTTCIPENTILRIQTYSFNFTTVPSLMLINLIYFAFIELNINLKYIKTLASAKITKLNKLNLKNYRHLLKKLIK